MQSSGSGLHDGSRLDPSHDVRFMPPLMRLQQLGDLDHRAMNDRIGDGGTEEGSLEQRPDKFAEAREFSIASAISVPLDAFARTRSVRAMQADLERGRRPIVKIPAVLRWIGDGGRPRHMHKAIFRAVSGMPAAVAASSSANMLAAWEPPASAIYAAYPGNPLMSIKVRAFVDHLARCFGKLSYRDAGL